MTEEEKEKNRARGREYAARTKEERAGYYQDYRKRNKEREAKRSKDWYEKNKTEILAKRKAKVEQNIEKERMRLRQASAAWRSRNLERVKAYNYTYRKERYASDPEWKAACRIREMLHRVIGQTSEPKWARSEEMIGYTRKELMAHLEPMFRDGMTWENFGEWHIDHIKPVSAFIKEGETNPAVINALSNLQPMWADENRRKGAKH